MSWLIDNCLNDPKEVIGGEWWLARPIPGNFISRLQNALKVLKGEAQAFHYKQDDCNKLEKLFLKKSR